MQEIEYDKRKWKELGFTDKMKFSLAGCLVASSILIGFISFLWLTFVPTSVIALSGLWLSTALAFLGISSYFHNELVKFQTEVKTKLTQLGTSEINNDDNKQ
jgi:hypothetical protein